MDKVELQEKATFLISNMKASLPREFDPVALSRVKLAFAPMASREALIWRMAELSNSACEAFRRDENGTGLILTRAAMECMAAVWFMMEKVRDFVPENFDAANEVLTKLWLGSRTDPAMPDPVNVLTMLDHADRKAPGVRARYDLLSEYSHPNWAAQTLYREINYETKVMHFGHYPGNAAILGLRSLIGSLEAFELAYNAIADLMPTFTANCEIAVPIEGRSTS